MKVIIMVNKNFKLKGQKKSYEKRHIWFKEILG
jgi:hypothetical protein